MASAVSVLPTPGGPLSFASADSSSPNRRRRNTLLQKDDDTLSLSCNNIVEACSICRADTALSERFDDLVLLFGNG